MARRLWDEHFSDLVGTPASRMEDDGNLKRLKAEAARARASEARLLEMAERVRLFVETVEERERRINAPKGGMSVPDHGDFVGIHKLPSVRSKLNWWARDLRDALRRAAEEGE